MVTLRDAAVADAPAMARLKTESLRARAVDSYTDRVLDTLAPRDPDPSGERAVLERAPFEGVVAEADGRVVGCGTVHVEDGQVHAVYVAPDRTGAAIGSRLLADLERRAVAAGRTELSVLATLNAVGFYERHGYERVERTSVGEDPSVPAVRLRKSA